MQIIKNIFVGFLISFIGSIPLGYLNIVGFEVFQKFGLHKTIFYLLGVISVEAIVIYFTLLFAKKLIANINLLKFIEGFSILFMFLLAYIFFANATKNSESQSDLEKYLAYSPFAIGLILSCFNFIQIPFWTSWNLYLLNGNYIEIAKTRKYFYVLGTIIGTFFGMLVLILSLNQVANQTNFFGRYLMKVIIPMVFIGLGIFQGIKFYKKYSK